MPELDGACVLRLPGEVTLEGTRWEAGLREPGIALPPDGRCDDPSSFWARATCAGAFAWMAGGRVMVEMGMRWRMRRGAYRCAVSGLHPD